MAAPSIPLSALSLPLVVFLPEFYSGPLGLSLSVVGTVFMLVRLADILFDPLFGGVMDRTRTRLGRFLPWMMFGAPIIMLGMTMLFTAEPGVGPLYLTVWLIVAYAGWSIVSLAQLALAANISPDYNERSRIFSWWQVAFMIGMILVMLLPKIVASMGATDAASGMRSMAWLVVILMPIMVGLTVLLVRERPTVSQPSHSGLRAYFGLLRLAVVRRLLLTELLLGLSSGTGSTLALFFYTRSKEIDRADVGMVFIAQFVVGTIAASFWSWLARRIGKHRALAVSAILYAVVQIGFYYAPAGNLAAVMLVSGGIGIVYAATAMLPRAMMADVADEERLNSGADRTGLLFALLIGVWKIGQALSVGLMFALLDMIGFDPAPKAVNSETALGGLTALFIGIPAVLSLAAAWAIYNYSLTPERHAQIRRLLAARDEAQES